MSSLDDYDDYNEYAADNDLPPITPPKWRTWNLDWGFDYLTETDKALLRNEFPTLQQRQREWGSYVLGLTKEERLMVVANKIAVLTGLYDDPEEWVATALRLASDA